MIPKNDASSSLLWNLSMFLPERSGEDTHISSHRYPRSLNSAKIDPHLRTLESLQLESSRTDSAIASYSGLEEVKRPDLFRGSGHKQIQRPLKAPLLRRHDPVCEAVIWYNTRWQNHNGRVKNLMWILIEDLHIHLRKTRDRSYHPFISIRQRVRERKRRWWHQPTRCWRWLGPLIRDNMPGLERQETILFEESSSIDKPRLCDRWSNARGLRDSVGGRPNYP